MEGLWAPWRTEFLVEARDGADACVFCTLPHEEGRLRENLVVARGRHAFVILNKYPYNNGHLLVIPYRHTAEFPSLTESEHAGSAGTLEISLYSRGIAIDYERGVVGEIRPIAGVEDPTDADGIGVAPDWFPALVLGRWGAREIARRVDDVIIARDHRLMDTLFPARRSDVAGDF